MATSSGVRVRCLSTALLLFTLTIFPHLTMAGENGVQQLPTEIPQDPPLLTADRDHNKLILTAGTQSPQAGDVPQPQVTMVREGSSARAIRNQAVASLGLNRLPRQNQQLAQGIVNDVSVFRRLPAFQCEVDPRVHDYFLNHPDVAVSLWRAMGISQMKLWETNPWAYGMDSNDGTTGTINVLYRSRESMLIVCRGLFKSPYLKNAINASSLIHMRTNFSTDERGRTFAVHQADLFVAFPSGRVEAVAKMVSPISNSIIDRNFQEISLFVHVMWLAMGRQPGWVEQMSTKMDGVKDERRKALVDLTADVYVTTRKEQARRRGESLELGELRPPMRRASRVSEAVTAPVSR